MAIVLPVALGLFTPSRPAAAPAPSGDTVPLEPELDRPELDEPEPDDSVADDELPTGRSRTVVTGQPPPTASTSEVSAEDLAAFPYRNAEDALRLVPGLTLVQHGSEGKGHQFFLRGFDAMHGADLAITVEGVPVNEWSNVHGHGFVDLGFVIPETISTVEVVKGPFTPTQGPFAMAGSADYRLGIAPDDRGARTSYTIGTTNRHRGVFTYSPPNGDGRDFFAVEALHDDAFGENRAIDRGALSWRLRVFDDAQRGALTVFGAGHLSRFELPGALRDEDVRAERIGFYDTVDSAGAGRSGRMLGGLTFARRSASANVRATIYAGVRRLELLENFTGYLLDPIDGDRRLQTQNATSYGADVLHTAQLHQRWTLSTGAGVRGDVFDQAVERVDGDERAFEVERELSAHQMMAHALTDLTWRPIEPFALNVGGRLDVAHASLRDGDPAQPDAGAARFAASPRVSARWQAHQTLTAFTAYGRGLRPPEARALTRHEPERAGFAELLYDGGDAKMTTSDAVEVGARWAPTPLFGAHAALFGTWIERESIYDHVSGLNLELNGTRRLGLEVEVHSEPVDWLRLSADVTAVDARFAESGRVVPLAPRLLGGARGILRHPSGARAGVRVSALAARPLPHGARGAPAAILDATAGYHHRSVRVDLAIENVLNLRRREGEYHYASDWRLGGERSELPAIHYVAGPPLNARLTVTGVF